MHEVMDRPLMPIDCAEAALGVKRSTIYKLIGAGELLRVHIGDRAFVTSESVNAYLGRLIADAKAGVQQ